MRKENQKDKVRNEQKDGKTMCEKKVICQLCIDFGKVNNLIPAAMKLWLGLDSDVKVDDDKLREDFDYIDLFLATHIITEYVNKKNMFTEMCEWVTEKYLILYQSQNRP